MTSLQGSNKCSIDFLSRSIFSTSELNSWKCRSKIVRVFPRKCVHICVFLRIYLCYSVCVSGVLDENESGCFIFVRMCKLRCMDMCVNLYVNEC